MQKAEQPKRNSSSNVYTPTKPKALKSPLEIFLGSAGVENLSRDDLLSLSLKIPFEKLTNSQISGLLSRLPDDRITAVCSFLIPLLSDTHLLERIIEVAEEAVERLGCDEYGGASFREHQWIKTDVKRGKYLYARKSMPGKSQERQDKYLCKVPFAPGQAYKVPQLSRSIRIEKFFVAPEQTWEEVLKTKSCFVSVEFLDDQLSWLESEVFPYPQCILDGYFSGCNFYEIADMPSEPYCRIQIPSDLVARCELNFATLASLSVNSWTLNRQDHESHLCFRDRDMMILDRRTGEIRVEIEPATLLAGIENLLQKNSTKGTSLNRQNALSLLERLRFSPKTSNSDTLYYLLTS